MDTWRIILISSVRAEASSGGEMLLHRHLCGQPNIILDEYSNGLPLLGSRVTIRRAVRRLNRMLLGRWRENFMILRKGSWLSRRLPKQIKDHDKTVVVTVAHGDGFYAALRFANLHQLPLLSFYHDWWPDIAGVHSFLRRQVDADFRHLYKHSSLSLCICPGMYETLGESDTACVLYPIPKAPDLPSNGRTIAPRSSQHLRIIYAGNLHEYGPMIGGLWSALKDNRTIKLEVRGRAPAWSSLQKIEMRSDGTWKEFAPRAEIESWMQLADIFLVPMSFDPKLERRMITSFPSKLPEYAQYRKPLIVWGPVYCSAIKWAQHGNRALCVTDPDPFAVVRAIEKLRSDENLWKYFARMSHEAANVEFSPEELQLQFTAALQRATSTGPVTL